MARVTCRDLLRPPSVLSLLVLVVATVAFDVAFLALARPARIASAWQPRAWPAVALAQPAILIALLGERH